MKLKIILLVLLSTLIIYIIYNQTYKKNINIVSINSLEENDNFNLEMADLLNKSNLYFSYNIDFSNNKLEIENLIIKMHNNEDKIQSILKQADVLIISIGNIDYSNEDFKTIVFELDKLFKELRNINKKQIYYISPKEIKNTLYVRKLCHKYNILYINGSSFNNNKQMIAQFLYQRIKNIYIK